MDFKERLAQKKANKKKKAKKVKTEVVQVSSGRKCGKCGQTGHNARTCGVFKPPVPVKKAAKAKTPVKPKKATEEPKTPVLQENNLKNRDLLQPPVKEILNELGQLLDNKEIAKPGRDDLILLEEYAKKRNPNKTNVLELKGRLDPSDLSNERYTLKKNLRDKGFRVPSNITTSELVQLAMKREVL